MKFIHISDLHLGKQVGGESIIEDQSFILDRIMDIVRSEKPDAVLIAGDVYDRSIPPAEAVSLLDRFIVNLSDIKLPNGDRMQTFIISGNHDSAERLAFGNTLMEYNGIHISPVYKGQVEPFVMRDEFGDVFIYMLPFIKPSHINNVLAENSEECEKVTSYNDAVKKAIEMMKVDRSARNILLSHQFVTGGSTCDSEVRSIGGLDNVDADVYSAFNYVALGHLHRPQQIKTSSSTNVLCYSGTPLKYSFSETDDKSVPIVTIDGDGAVSVERRKLTPLHDMRTVEGSFAEIASADDHNDDFVRVILKEDQISNYMMHDLKKFYSNLVLVMTEYEKQTHDEIAAHDEYIPELNEFDTFKAFFEQVMGRSLNEDEHDHMVRLIDSLIEKRAGQGRSDGQNASY